MARKGLRCLVDAAPLRMQIRTVMSLVRLQEIESLTAFRRDTSRHLKELARTGRPKLLTVNGRAALVVQDAAAFETMMDRLETLAGVARGLAAVRAGEHQPARAVFQEIASRRRLPRP